MAASFFFYDLETSGFSPRDARIMQFAGQRTDLELKPIGEPVNLLIRMTNEILPDPDAVLLTGITPQATLADGLTEAEFLQEFVENIAKPHTIFLGYNTVRFDDEFMRFLHYRNFYDPYEWQWQDGRSKWDLLDVVRMTRALRPDGIKWPFDVHGNPTNRLELLSALNKLEHAHAHDALSDVYATIEVARLIRGKQTRLFEYLLSMRDKKKVAELAHAGQPFVYTSGQYASEFEKTTVVWNLADQPGRQSVLVYDLRHDPTDFINLSPEELAKAWAWKKPDDPGLRLPIKAMRLNCCPAVAPLGVLDAATQARLKIDLPTVQKHLAVLKKSPQFTKNVLAACELREAKYKTQGSLIPDDQDADGRLYDGFLNDQDRTALRLVRAAAPEELGDLADDLGDDRLKALLPLYKARNFARKLTNDEREAWEQFRTRRLMDGGTTSRMAKFFARLQELGATTHLSDEQRYLLEELKLYAESIMPSDESAA